MQTSKFFREYSHSDVDLTAKALSLGSFVLHGISEVIYNGHKLTPEGVQPDPEMIELLGKCQLQQIRKLYGNNKLPGQIHPRYMFTKTLQIQEKCFI